MLINTVYSYLAPQFQQLKLVFKSGGVPEIGGVVGRVQWNCEELPFCTNRKVTDSGQSEEEVEPLQGSWNTCTIITDFCLDRIS
jgi:hypothetical protein